MAVIDHLDHEWFEKQSGFIRCLPCDVPLFQGFNPENKGQKAKKTIAQIMDGTYLDSSRLHLPEATN